MTEIKACIDFWASAAFLTLSFAYIDRICDLMVKTESPREREISLGQTALAKPYKTGASDRLMPKWSIINCISPSTVGRISRTFIRKRSGHASFNIVAEMPIHWSGALSHKHRWTSVVWITRDSKSRTGLQRLDHARHPSLSIHSWPSSSSVLAAAFAWMTLPLLLVIKCALLSASNHPAELLSFVNSVRRDIAFCNCGEVNACIERSPKKALRTRRNLVMFWS